MPPPSDLNYLSELIRDFPAREGIVAGEAWKEIESRYLQLEKICPQITDVVRQKLMNQTDVFHSFFVAFITAWHYILFYDILSNAGQYRKLSDPNNGYVGFGGTDTRSRGNARFHGSPSARIGMEVEEAVRFLSLNDPNPIKSSIFFYQRFVKVHPFYDANGRIGRLIVTIYLDYYGYQVLWKELETTKKNKFLGKLNECHKRESGAVNAQYLEYLYQFWKAFVISNKELKAFVVN